jgi:hypothetical protein
MPWMFRKGEATKRGRDHWPLPEVEKWHSTWPLTGRMRLAGSEVVWKWI